MFLGLHKLILFQSSVLSFLLIYFLSLSFLWVFSLLLFFLFLLFFHTFLFTSFFVHTYIIHWFVILSSCGLYIISYDCILFLFFFLFNKKMMSIWLYCIQFLSLSVIIFLFHMMIIPKCIIFILCIFLLCFFLFHEMIIADYVCIFSFCLMCWRCQDMCGRSWGQEKGSAWLFHFQNQTN